MRGLGVAALAVGAFFFWAVRSTASSVVVGLRPVSDRHPDADGDIEICCEPQATVYGVNLYNLPPREFSVVLADDFLPDADLGTLRADPFTGEARATFFVSMNSPVGRYSRVLVTEGNRRVLTGELPGRR